MLAEKAAVQGILCRSPDKIALTSHL